MVFAIPVRSAPFFDDMTTAYAPSLLLSNSLRPTGAHEVSSPVVVVGMHRSVTSLFTRLLAELGVFFGRTKNLNHNHEAMFFVELNQWIFRYAGATWGQPRPLSPGW